MRLNKLAALLLSSMFADGALAADAANWSYEGLSDGQDSWAQLSQEYALCETGTQQSPVVISFTSRTELPALNFSYTGGKATITRTNNALDIAITGNNSLTVGDISYQLKHIQFHSPSEHTVLDKYYVLEIHLMHQSADGKKLNIAVFGESSTANEALELLTSIPPLNMNESKDITVNPAIFLPLSFGYYAYSGSMTYPPCTEGVEWRVLKKPIGLTYKQQDFFIKQVGRNSRLEQPLYTRIISETKF